ncbi:MAG: HAMP domain-containing histidine kinase [Lachnospiraceae bacterium]|nr:HAMP domain-containing histidine kinase [Lachnospiraceae bacterium]
MKSIKKFIKKHNPLRKSLYIELFTAVLVSAVTALLINVIMIAITFAFIDSNWFYKKVVAPVLDEKSEALQEYVLDNNLTTENTKSLDVWFKLQGPEHIGIYIENENKSDLIYEHSFAKLYDDMQFNQTVVIDNVDEYIEEFTLCFADETTHAYMISDSVTVFLKSAFFIIDWLTFGTFILVFVLIIRRKIKYIKRITDAIYVLENDNLDYEIPEEGCDEITSVAKSLNHMRVTLSKQMESEKQAIQANNSLVTALSHDLRTPLTTQLGYLEILKEHHYSSEEELQEYLDKVLENGKQIKMLSDRLFEYFLAFDRNTESLQQRERADALELFLQLITEHTMYLEEQGFTFLLDEPEEQFFIEVNPEDCMRIFNNVFSNIEKYADKAERVIIRIKRNTDNCEVIISNRINQKPKQNESAKVGLESLRALMRRQGGQFQVERNNIGFRVTLTFPIYK